ncbi:heart- and neural crest derivatives-expressed protein 1 [Pleurodeles waltl]
MNLVGGYHQPHPHMMHDPFLFPPRCPQDRPYFQGWLLNSADMSPEFANPPPFSPEYAVPGPVQGPGRLETLAGRLGRRKGGPSPPKKERRRTESINSAFAELRDCIPNVPADTKLSKIKTLRLATSYIGYLMEVLARDSQPEEAEAFKAELKRGDKKKRGETGEVFPPSLGPGEKKMKGRTGWPQQVWALELNP